MSQIAYAASFLKIVQEALQLGDQPVRRAVIDIQASGAVRVLLERFVKDEELDYLGALLRELPRTKPGIEWVDRISVEPGNGGEVCVKRFQQEETPVRETVKAIVEFLQHATPEQHRRMQALIQEV